MIFLKTSVMALALIILSSTTGLKGILVHSFRKLSKLNLFKERQMQLKKLSKLEALAEVDTILLDYHGTLTCRQNLDIENWLLFGQSNINFSNKFISSFIKAT